MRRTAGLLVTLPLLLAVACSSSTKPVSQATPTASPSAAPTVPAPVNEASPMPTLSGGGFGSKATITIPEGQQPSGQFVVNTVSEGDRSTVNKGDWVTVNYTAKDWTTGKDLPSSYDSGGKPQLYQAGSGQLVPAFDQSVIGKKVGSRLLVVAPPAAAFGTQGSTQLGVAGGDTVVFVLDIMESLPPDATLSGAMTQPPANLPQVKDNGKAAVTITVPAGQAPPTELQQAVLIKGEGKQVKSGQTLVVQYTGVLWANGQQFDSSWSHGGAQALQIGTGSVIEGWDKGLVGQTVGSRVELVVPPALGYKDQAQGAVPANSTLVFVIDILEAV
ncbi:FKBP-type peptidyl-prolyl cis-trans isomerase [Kitasatospora purpeofusca]|uniref:FKBP-type peptidyl-prolyl cis-trans isomerase n=1 Tax=Kitasatospora purpeofusca TaxID=67352 RepID=UPI000B3316DE|nr:FKBP-type peptidyl-prolyl cis-trans isomerase [Kitasatospora purpeofusca]MCX4758058.1 FKBP-type peptidyl-prolyl cis-trans isomerase [Kitasatospora purpeofusca]WSR31465.1 FKBP-type peptidyl-prolyl cis-trans isomerase [Kitasatospora purpeofusca]WSR39487.1 FKBP-type peptidyl-prolyl cis-trans isomerase [Kitasatospora purpeofusca]